MSSTLNTSYGTAASLTFSGLNSLTAGSKVVSSAVVNTTTLAVDFFVEITIADVTESGNKQVLVFAVESLDGTTFSDTGSQANEYYLGAIDLTGTGPQTRAFPLAAAFGGLIPPQFKVAVLNDAGVTLASSGNSGRVLPIFFTAT